MEVIMEDAKIGFIGFGLIGGSIARALKQINPKNVLFSYNYYGNGRMGKGLDAALKDRVLDYVTNSLEEGFPDCDMIFLCAPVLSNIAYLKQLKPLIRKDCILTDVGSVKGNIHQAIEELGLNSQFIGGHPMAGSEKTGYENSHAKLLENAYYILTPTREVPPDKVDTLFHMVEEIGAIPLILADKEHDDITAAISHVPHIIAAALVNMVRTSDDGEEKMRTLAAGGFKDITRIASSSPVMWQNICLTNTSSIKHFLSQYISVLQEVYNSLEDEAYLYRFFEDAGEYRNSLPGKTGLLKQSYEICLDITDEAGAIAAIATQLAKQGINIKNIGILHNREFQEGVLHIEFYEEPVMKNAIDLLKEYGYTVYERT